MSLLQQNRRTFLGTLGHGLTGVALARLLQRDLFGAGPGPHFPAKARQVLHIFCPGGASHMDLWEHKPALEKFDGTPLPGPPEVSFQGRNGNLMKSPWSFAPRGQCGKMWSALLPHLGAHVDDIAFLHGMTSRTNTHGPGCVFMNCGFVREGFPSTGAWTSHALGSLNENLPTYVALQDIRGEPPNGKANWGHGFLPAHHQAVVMAAHQPLRNLNPPPGVGAEEDAATRAFLMAREEDRARAHAGETELRARISAYELAARMQLAAPEVGDLKREPEQVHAFYQTSDANPLKAAYARNCLLARRLLEKGVRYVSLYCASRASAVDGFLNWDAHKTLRGDYERHCPIFDQPTSTLLADLKQRGMLETTLVLWTTEFGRMPTHQEGTEGRDHNPDGFTVWLMGAGVKGGVSHGSTDDFGRRAITDVSTVHDLYATVLHLLGLDHEKLTYYHNGANRRLTDVHGHVITPILG